MSDFEVLQTYASWAGTAVPDKLPGIPFANLDVFENESILRNRLFYLVPDTSSGELRCFSYLEDNLFAKEPNGDLSLLESSLHLFSQEPCVYMKKGIAIFLGWLFPFVYCVAGVDAYTKNPEKRRKKRSWEWLLLKKGDSTLKKISRTKRQTSFHVTTHTAC